MSIKAKKIRKPELLAPAGDWCALRTALDAGADAVYFGVKGLNMRAWAGNFDLLEMKKVMAAIHDKGKKGYCALNTLIYNRDMSKVRKVIDTARKAGVDAVILWDMSVLKLANDAGIPVHLSTQASVANFAAVQVYHALGVKRIVLARECALSDIQDILKGIKKQKLDCSIEVFIHGALCVSVSGRCLLSHAAFGKSANRGECLQPCRREYSIRDMGETDTEFIVGSDYILSPRDLCTMPFIEKLIRSGIHAFKIEGRMRSAEYVRDVTGAYRGAIDSFYGGKLTAAKKKTYMTGLSRAYNRGFSDGFFFTRPDDTGSVRGTSAYDKQYAGKVMTYYKKINVAAIKLTNADLKKGQQILLSGATTPARVFTIDEMHIEHEPTDHAKKGGLAAIKVPFRVRKNDKIFLYTLLPGNAVEAKSAKSKNETP